jgi:hypothetical protein
MLYVIAQKLPFRREWVAIHVAALVVSAIPVYIVAVMKLSGWTIYCPTVNWWWGIDYGALNYALLTASLHCWKRMTSAFGPLSDMLGGAHSSVSEELTSWWLASTRLRVQAIWMVVGCVGAAVGALLLVTFSQNYVHRTVLTDTTAILSGIIAGHSIYCIVTGVLLAYRVADFPGLHLTWNCPINTPAFLEISDTARVTAQLGLVCFFLAAAPLTYVEIVTDAPVIAALYLGALLTTGGFVLVVGVGVQLRLSGRVRRAKLRVLDDLTDDIAQLRRKWGARGALDPDALTSLHATVGIYDAVDRSSSSYLNPAVVAQYVASTLAVMLQLVIPVLVK